MNGQTDRWIDRLMVPQYAVTGHVIEFIRLFLVSGAERHCVDISTRARKKGQVTTAPSAEIPSGAVAGESRENPATETCTLEWLQKKGHGHPQIPWD